MKKMLVNLVVLWSSLLIAAAVADTPVYSWDFEDMGRTSGKLTSRAYKDKEGRRYTFLGTPVKNQGWNNSIGIQCMQNRFQFASFPLNFKQFMLEMKFKLQPGLTSRKGKVLFAYSTGKLHQKRMMIWITHQNRIEALFQIYKEDKKLEKEFSLITPSLQWRDGQYYKLRFSSVSGGRATIELDGKILASSDNALSLSDLSNPQPDKSFPVAYFGFYPFEGNVRKSLNGYVDEIKIYDKVDSSPDLNPVLPVKQSESTGSMIPHLCLDNQWSRPFLVADQPGKLLGTYVKAEEKFIQNAAKVRINQVNENLRIEFDCPIPKGMKAQCRPSRIWNDDHVEVFLQPDPQINKYFQYAVGVNGDSYAGCGLNPMPESKAVFSVKNTDEKYVVFITIPLRELGLESLTPGTWFKGNFIRAGMTAGGSSFWNPPGNNFHSPESFGLIIAGSPKEYFHRKIQQYKNEFAFSEESSAGEKIKILSNLINKSGNDPDAFNKLEKLFTSLEYNLIQQRLDKMRQLIWLPPVWENNMNLSRLAKPLKKIRVKAGINSRKMIGFAVSNLEDEPFIGQIKVFKTWPYPTKVHNFAYQEWNDFLDQIRIHEGIASADANGRRIYDTISALPMNTLLRIPPKTTLPVWLEISTRKLKPGKYFGTIVLKDCSGKPNTETVQLEVEVADVDLDEYYPDNFCYTSLMRSAWEKENIRRFFVRYHFNYMYILPGPSNMSLYWKRGKNRTLIPGKLEHLDQFIDRAVSSGFSLPRSKILFFLAWNLGHGGRPDTKEWKERMTVSLQQIVAHLKQKYNISPGQIIFYPIDEPNGDINDPQTSMGKVLRWGKFIKTVVPQCKLMVNPLSSKFDAARREAFTKLAECYDIFELYRPNADDSKLRNFLKPFNKEIWTYNILMKSHSPEVYRRDHWKNRRDGFSSVTAFWDLNDHAGGDGFDPSDFTRPSGRIKRTDYGMIYVDCNYGTYLTGRRFEAAMMGLEEMRIARICQNRIESLKRKKVDVRRYEKSLSDALEKGADGTMSDMDAQSDRILELAETLICLDKSTQNSSDIR